MIFFTHCAVAFYAGQKKGVDDKREMWFDGKEIIKHGSEYQYGRTD